jgi:prepilin-type processing-associated H-X9-DG protein
MDTKQVIARFEAERQALALLDHPNIAHVFSAGTTEAGRPYFAMEYVKGDPITEHWDRCRLTDCERPGSTIYLADNEDGPWRAIIRNATDSGFTKCDVFLPTHLPNSDTQTIGEGRRVARARHRNGCNVLYLDWHADWMGAEDMTVDMWKFKNSN